MPDIQNTAIQVKPMIYEMNYYGRNKIPFIFIIDFLMKKPVILPVDDVDISELMYNFNGFTNSRCVSALPREVHLGKRPVSYETYKSAFEIITNHQIEGDSYLANLTFPTPIDINLTLQELFLYSRAPYRLWYRDCFVVFSPEPFIRIDNSVISSFPMKGTIDAAVPGARELLLRDEKEYAEHVTIVDLIRNDLNMVSTGVTVKRFRYIDVIETHTGSLLQASSHITGTLPPDYHEKIGSIIAALLPAGSVTGAPKKRTVEIIMKAENYDRGYYTGICGYFDGEKLDSGVMIRFIEKNDEGVIFKSGGGITVYSDPEREYQELVDKVYVPIV
jgi:para-aminobenzoate synthetase component I